MAIPSLYESEPVLDVPPAKGFEPAFGVPRLPRNLSSADKRSQYRMLPHLRHSRSSPFAEGDLVLLLEGMPHGSGLLPHAPREASNACRKRIAGKPSPGVVYFQPSTTRASRPVRTQEYG